MKRIALLLTGFAAVWFTGCTNPHTPAYHEGYVYEEPRFFGKGGFRGIVEGPGNFGISPWRNKVVNIDTRPATYDEDLKILAKDDLNVVFHFAAVIKLEKGKVKEVVQQYGGTGWYKRFVQQPFRTYIRNAVQHYSSREVKAKRDTLAAEVRQSLENHLADSPFQLVNLVVGNIDYPKVVSEAVEKKLAARQLLEEKAIQREIAQRNAEITIEEAKGIAEAQRIIDQTLTANYLQHEAIAAQKEMASSPNHTTVYIPVGSNGMPLVYNTERRQ